MALTPAQVRDKVLAYLEDRLPALRTRQTAFRTLRGRFFQGAPTHATLPLDGADVAPDLTRRPSDQVETWADFGLALGALIPCSMEIHVYTGPQGSGYIVRPHVSIGGRRWFRSHEVGPEGTHSHGWVEELPDVREPLGLSARVGGTP